MFQGGAGTGTGLLAASSAGAAVREFPNYDNQTVPAYIGAGNGAQECNSAEGLGFDGGVIFLSCKHTAVSPANSYSLKAYNYTTRGFIRDFGGSPNNQNYLFRSLTAVGGSVWVSEGRFDRVHVFSASTGWWHLFLFFPSDLFLWHRGLIGTFGSSGTGNNQFGLPLGIGVAPVAGLVFVADFSNKRISVWNFARQYVRNFSTGTKSPSHVAVDEANGFVFVSTDGELQTYNMSTGTLLFNTAAAGSLSFGGSGLVLLPSSYLYVVANLFGRVEEWYCGNETITTTTPALTSTTTTVPSTSSSTSSTSTLTTATETLTTLTETSTTLTLTSTTLSLTLTTMSTAEPATSTPIRTTTTMSPTTSQVSTTTTLTAETQSPTTRPGLAARSACLFSLLLLALAVLIWIKLIYTQ